MLGVFLGLYGEVTSNDIVVRQLFSTEGAYNAMLVSGGRPAVGVGAPSVRPIFPAPTPLDLFVA